MTKKILYLYDNFDEEHPIIEQTPIIIRMIQGINASRKLNESIIQEVLKVDFEKWYPNHPLNEEINSVEEEEEEHDLYIERWESTKHPVTLEEKLQTLKSNIGKVESIMIMDYSATDRSTGRKYKKYTMSIGHYSLNTLFEDVIVENREDLMYGIHDYYDIFGFELSEIEECAEKLGEYWELKRQDIVV